MVTSKTKRGIAIFIVNEMTLIVFALLYCMYYENKAMQIILSGHYNIFAAMSKRQYFIQIALS